MSINTESRSQNRQYQTCVVANVYPPASKRIVDLAHIRISDLRPGNHHFDSVLLLRATGYPEGDRPVRVAVEDRYGAVERLVVHHTPDTDPPEQWILRGAIIAVKEPVYETDPDGAQGRIRVDHLSNVVRLAENDHRVPQAFRPAVPAPPKFATTWQAEGHTARQRDDFIKANDCYSEALSACPAADRTLRQALQRSRAESCQHLGRHEAALDEALASIILATGVQDDVTAHHNAAAYHRAGLATYGLRRFREAAGYFRDADRCAPGTALTKRLLDQTLERIGEEDTGVYDFVAMSNGVSTQHNRLDHADFLKRCEVRDAEDRGQGLFATEDIKAGELVLVEKAFGLAFASDEPQITDRILDTANDCDHIGPDARLLYALLKTLSLNTQQAARFFALYDGGYEYPTELQDIDGVPVIDTFRTLAIATRNRFCCPSVRSTDYFLHPNLRPAKHQDDESSGEPSSGVWLRASRINHACDGNVVRCWIGDMLILHASRDIKRGGEITLQYVLPKVTGVDTQDATERTWGFRCDCALCERDMRTPEEKLIRRKALAEEVRKFMRDEDADDADGAMVSKGKKLYYEMKKTFDGRVFAGKPRPVLIELGEWLCRAYRGRSSHDHVVECALRLLRDHGYNITVTPEGLAVDESHCTLGYLASDAAVFASVAYSALGERENAKRFAELARKLWQTIYAEMRGFEGRYGKLKV